MGEQVIFNQCMQRMARFIRRATVYLLIVTVVEFIVVDCAPICGAGQFYDRDAGMCDFCDKICDNAAIQKTLLKCLRNCRDYLTTSKLSASTLSLSTLTTVDRTTTVSPPPPVRHFLQWPEIVAIILSVAVIIVAVVGAAWINKQRLCRVMEKIKSRCTWGEEEVKYPVQVEEDRSDGGNEMSDDNDVHVSPEDGLMD